MPLQVLSTPLRQLKKTKLQTKPQHILIPTCGDAIRS